MRYEELLEVNNLISIRNYIDSTINNMSFTRQEVTGLQVLIEKIDKKIVKILLSKQFEQHIDFL